MAKDKQYMYTLKCPACGAMSESIFQHAICTACGNIAAVVPLDGAFEEAAEGDIVIKSSKPVKKAASDTANRTAEDGGRTF